MATASKSTTKAKTDSATTDKTEQSGFDQVKAAMPSATDAAALASDVGDYVAEHANVDVREMANDAAEFVRRNPGTSLAAAAGVGLLIGVLVAKRS